MVKLTPTEKALTKEQKKLNKLQYNHWGFDPKVKDSKDKIKFLENKLKHEREIEQKAATAPKTNIDNSKKTTNVTIKDNGNKTQNNSVISKRNK